MSFIEQIRQQSTESAQSTSQTPGFKLTPSAKASLKTYPGEWTRTFSGQGKGVSFELKIQRDSGGHLHGRYIATPGNPAGWHLEGQIREDNTFALKGTKNDALFEGTFDAVGVTLSASFRNKDFQIEKLQLKRQQGKISLKSGQQSDTTGTSQQSGDVKHWTQTLTPEMRKRLPALAEPEFVPTLQAMCKRLNIPADMLLAVMTFESADARRKTRGLDPQADNGLGYYGLIQFGADAAADLGLADATQFKSMSAVQQLVYVEKFLLQHGLKAAQDKANKEGRPLSLEELYMSVLGGHTSAAYKDAWKTRAANPKGYANNIGLDSNHDGKITPVEAADAVRLHWRDVYGNNVDERSRHLERQWYVEGGERKWRTKEHAGIYSAVLNGTTGSVAPPESEVSASAPAAAEQSNSISPDPKLSPLDRLLGLKTAKDSYTDGDILLARQVILKQPAAQRRQYYLDLQSKTAYRNQRNNQTTDGGESAGDDMCNVTSLAMCLDTVGIGKPKSLIEHSKRFKNGPKLTEEKLSAMQYEDYLDLIRRYYKLGPRTSYVTLSKITEKMGAEWEQLAPPAARPWKKQLWEDHAGAALSAGHGVIFSIRGHIVRLQSVQDEGLVVDDPYGNIKLLAGIDEGDYLWEATNPEPGTGRTGAVGKDQVWPWREVEKHVLWWMGAVKKA